MCIPINNKNCSYFFIETMKFHCSLRNKNTINEFLCIKNTYIVLLYYITLYCCHIENGSTTLQHFVHACYDIHFLLSVVCHHTNKGYTFFLDRAFRYIVYRFYAYTFFFLLHDRHGTTILQFCAFKIQEPFLVQFN